jgi:hypothetical protein
MRGISEYPLLYLACVTQVQYENNGPFRVDLVPGFIHLCMKKDLLATETQKLAK